MKFEMAPREVAGFLAAGGWTAQEVLTGPDLSEQYLKGTAMPRRFNPSASFAAATRATR